MLGPRTIAVDSSYRLHRGGILWREFVGVSRARRVRNELVDGALGAIGLGLGTEHGKGLEGKLREIAEDGGGARIGASGSDLDGEAVDEPVDGGGRAEVCGELRGEMR